MGMGMRMRFLSTVIRSLLAQGERENERERSERTWGRFVEGREKIKEQKKSHK